MDKIGKILSALDISVSNDAYPNGETYANVGSGWVSVPLFNVDMTFQTWGVLNSEVNA